MKIIVLVTSLLAVALARPDIGLKLREQGYNYQVPSTSYGNPIGYQQGYATHQHQSQVPSGSYIPGGQSLPQVNIGQQFSHGHGHGVNGISGSGSSYSQNYANKYQAAFSTGGGNGFGNGFNGGHGFANGGNGFSSGSNGFGSGSNGFSSGSNGFGSGFNGGNGFTSGSHGFGGDNGFSSGSGFTSSTGQLGGSGFNGGATGGFSSSGQFGSTSSFQSFGQEQQTKVAKHVYFYDAPFEQEEPRVHKPIAVPPATKNYKVIFIKAPTQAPPVAPVIPAQQQNEEKTLVYVLVKKPEEQPDIHIPAPIPTQPSKPEVYFIKYKTKEEAQNHIQGTLDGQHHGGVSANAVNNGQEFVSTITDSAGHSHEQHHLHGDGSGQSGLVVNGGGSHGQTDSFGVQTGSTSFTGHLGGDASSNQGHAKYGPPNGNSGPY